MGFITRRGTQLRNNGTQFRFFGMNIFWLGLTSYEGNTNGSYPFNAQIDDALQTAVEMGCTVVRSHTLGNSTGNSLSIWPTLNTTNTAAFNPIDYAIYKGGLLGLKFIIPLTDNHQYYHGGIYDFLAWRSLSLSNPSAFYTNSTVIADFEAYINVVLTRVNQFNGLAYKDDPAIMCWETGNEMAPPSTSWTSTIAAYIKSVDSNHLVMDGSTLGVSSAALTDANVDIITNHMYPVYNATMLTDVVTTLANSKAYVLGEFDWKTSANSTGTGNIDTSTFNDGTQSARIDVTVASSDNFQIKLRQTSSTFGLVTGKTYTFAFWAKASVARQIQANIQSTVTPFSTYTATILYNVTTSWAQYNTTFTVPSNDDNIFVQFSVGAVVSSVWIDTVSVTASGVSNLVLNPSFETGLTNWAMVVQSGNNDLDTIFPAIEGNPNIAGSMPWALMPHAHVNGFDLYVDHFPIYYPVGLVNQLNAQTDQPNRFALMRAHGFKMQSRYHTPQALKPLAPALTFTSSGGVNTIKWPGVVGASYYTLERASSGSGPWTTLGTYTDFQTPITDTASPSTLYRVHATNVDGNPGYYSSFPPAQIGGNMPANFLPVDVNGRPTGSGYDPLTHLPVSSQIVNVQTDGTTTTAYGAQAEAPMLLNNATGVLEQQHSANGEYDSKGVGLEMHANVLSNINGPGGVTYDRIRSIQGKASQSQTISGTLTVGATSVLLVAVGALQPGQPMLFTGGTNEVIYVSPTWNGSTTVTLQSAVVQSGHVGVTFEIYGYFGASANSVMPFGIQPFVPTIFDPAFFNYYHQCAYTGDARPGQNIPAYGPMVYNGTNNDRVLGVVGAMDVNTGGRHATGVSAATPLLIKTGVGCLKGVIVTVLGTAAMFFYDATSATGLIIGALPASAPIGYYPFNAPSTSGIYAGGATNTPGCTVVWS